MKTILRIFVLCLFTTCATRAETPTADSENKPDPIVGNWRWASLNFTVEIRANGTFESSEQSVGSGVWKFIPGSNTERKYELSWRKGAIVDHLTLSRDGKKLSGKNSKGDKLSSQRVE